ncbi:MAG TPA: ABC transporter permease [Bryobacteraceae bacterium]|nr:ABC transporter permease [Bryobacteraceae bacterium]
MRLVRILFRRGYSLLRKRRAEEELARELEIHIEQLEREFVAGGMSASEARLAARKEFGPVEVTTELCRDMRRVNLLEDLFKDLVYTSRVLGRSPAFTLTAVLSLALGIGANTVVFSVLNALVLKPLPIPEPRQLVFVNNSGQPANSFPNYREIRDRNQVFQSLFAYRIEPVSLGDERAAHRVWGYLATGNYFQALGLEPAIGRFYTPAEDTQTDASPYVVLSYSCWQNRFSGDPNIPGKEVRINGRPFTVLGVGPRGFHGTEAFYWSEIWIPMTMQPQIEGHSWLEAPSTFNSWIAGRLKPGISIEQAQANLKTIAMQLARERTVNEGMQLTLSAPGLAGSAGREPTRAFTLGVMLLASLVLFAACANLAALLTARAADRERDLAIRVSIGAARGRIVRQLLTESLTISVTGGAIGCALAVVLCRLLSQWRAPMEFPIQFDVNPDWRVFLFAIVAAIVTGILFGIGPARRAWKADPAMSLKGLSTHVSARSWSGRDILLPLQVALCCVLVTASLVAVRGLVRSFRTPLGFQPDGAAVVGYDVGLAGYNPRDGALFEERALRAVSQLPGVESAAYSSTVPLSIDQSTNTVYPENTTDFRPRNAIRTSHFNVSPGYFHTAGTRLLAGREFTPQDDATSPRVAVVNRTFARRVAGTEDAVGRRFRLGPDTLIQIAGIVEDGKYENLTEYPKAALFLPIQQDYSSTIVLMVRSARAESEMAGEMRQALSRLDPNLAIYGVGALNQMLGLVYLPMHAAVITLGAFGILALMLAITGIYGLAAYAVSRRSREIGIRLAIGARPSQILRSIFGRIGKLVTAGAFAGLGWGLAGAGVMASIVYQASSRDPLVIGASVLAIAAVAIIAAFGPARRAMRVDPVQSLRHD